MKIETEFRLENKEMNIPPIYLIRAELDRDLFSRIENGEYGGFGDITKGIIDKFVEKIYPEMEQRILSDPTFKDRILNEVLVILANKISKKVKKKNGKQ